MGSEITNLEVRALRDDERAGAGGVAGRALSSNPTFRWVFGEDALVRVRGTLDSMVGFVSRQDGPLGALLGGHLVGICAASAPGACMGATAPDEYRERPEKPAELGDPARGRFVWSLMCTHDLPERHWHVGPVSVEPALHGLGIGSAMLTEFVAQMDEAGEIAWLETDKPENVVFYRRHGFEVAEEIAEFGLTTWFMRRDPR
jgi:ribosomal protein S18 acetylase RimI-like enzyme